MPVSAGPYRSGPWPGLTPRGAVVLLGCAVLLGVAELLVGEPRRALPDLPLLGALALLPMATAVRIVSAPGAASAVCGAYLLPRSLVSLLFPEVQPPPLLLAPAIVFDLALWLRAGDLARAWRGMRNRGDPWRRRPAPITRQPTAWRGAAAGALFGLTLALVEPAYALLLGGDAANWSGAQLWSAGVATIAACAVVGAITGRGGAAASGRGTAL